MHVLHNKSGAPPQMSQTLIFVLYNGLGTIMKYKAIGSYNMYKRLVTYLCHFCPLLFLRGCLLVPCPAASPSPSSSPSVCTTAPGCLQSTSGLLSEARSFVLRSVSSWLWTWKNVCDLTLLVSTVAHWFHCHCEHFTQECHFPLLTGQPPFGLPMFFASILAL